MVDPEPVRRRLAEIDRRAALLRQIEAKGKDRLLADLHLQAEAERHLQLAIQAAIDAANHVLAEDFPDTPSSYREVFELLARNGVLEEPLARRLAEAVGLRNILVHAYLDVDPTLIWEALGRLSDLEALARRLERYLSA